MHSLNIAARTAEYARAKLTRCVRLARASNQDWRQTRNRCFAAIRDEAMSDARYWRGMLTDAERTS